MLVKEEERSKLHFSTSDTFLPDSFSMHFLNSYNDTNWCQMKSGHAQGTLVLVKVLLISVRFAFWESYSNSCEPAKSQLPPAYSVQWYLKELPSYLLSNKTVISPDA